MTSSNPTPFARRVLLCLLATVVFLTGIHLLMQYLNLNVYHELNGQVFEISNRVDFDDEASIPTWISQLILLAIGLSAFVAAYLQQNSGAKRIWTIIGAIGIVLSLDEVAALHELLLQIVHLAVFSEVAPTIRSNAWFVLLPFIVVVGAFLLFQAIRHISRRTVFIFILGTTIFMTGAVFIDVLTNASNINNFYEKGVLVGAEESLEIAGTSTVLYGILDYLESVFTDRIRAARARLKG